jgi:hypothetical protein
VLTDTLPSSVEFVSASSTAGTCSEANGVVTCELGTLRKGKDNRATITITVRPTKSGRIVNKAFVSAATPDPDVSNNEDRERTDIQ